MFDVCSLDFLTVSIGVHESLYVLYAGDRLSLWSRTSSWCICVYCGFLLLVSEFYTYILSAFMFCSAVVWYFDLVACSANVSGR